MGVEIKFDLIAETYVFRKEFEIPMK